TDPGQVHHDLEGARRLVHVGVWSPASLHEQAHALELPEILEESLRQCGARDHGVAIAQTSVAQDSLLLWPFVPVILSVTTPFDSPSISPGAYTLGGPIATAPGIRVFPFPPSPPGRVWAAKDGACERKKQERRQPRPGGALRCLEPDVLVGGKGIHGNDV